MKKVKETKRDLILLMGMHKNPPGDGGTSVFRT